MSSSKEADLTTAVLLYAMRCLAEGDQQALRAMNFGPKELDGSKSFTGIARIRTGSRVFC